MIDSTVIETTEVFFACSTILSIQLLTMFSSQPGFLGSE